MFVFATDISTSMDLCPRLYKVTEVGQLSLQVKELSETFIGKTVINFTSACFYSFQSFTVTELAIYFESLTNQNRSKYKRWERISTHYKYCRYIKLLKTNL